MARSKRHHYISQSFQDRFCRTDGRIWYAERNDDGEFSLFDRTPYGCFWKPNLNTTMVDDRPSDELETGFWGDVDDQVAKFLQLVDRSFEDGRPPVLEGESLVRLKELITSVARRAPDATDLPDADELGEQFRSNISYLSREAGFRYDPKYDDRTWLRQTGRSILASAKAEYPKMVLEALQEYSVRWAVLEGKSSFILGSKSVYRAHGDRGSGHLADPKTELYWPIAPKLALVLLRPPSRDFPLVLRGSTQMVREWNMSICRESACVASHSKSLLVSLLGRRLTKVDN